MKSSTSHSVVKQCEMYIKEFSVDRVNSALFRAEYTVQCSVLFGTIVWHNAVYCLVHLR